MRAPEFRDQRIRIGLTGGIASGKSTVARLFGAHGVPVIDLDQVAREVVAPGEPGLAEIVAAFGTEVLAADGTLDRARLRARVFHDPPARKRLEAMLHPRIFAAAVAHAEAAGGPYQVIVAPLLVEFGLADWPDRVLVVDCPAETQLERLLARDGGDETLARAILASQATREQRLAAADDVIVNDGPPERLAAAVDTLDALYREMAAGAEHDPPGLRLP
ncbi:dephospho-CoA kinase [Wenzhouxiangella sp. XN24]|uniref:dephospho-CoA kinase n=1 Tax=Wenzhouxiangella sp. XN24 TaxID=2713569 RepID=UPI0013EBC3E1|nr:dephospho-CoA kinase [Wenzhouxiangella sp. XN24]NGX15237.1 dephospho-CoA kinase [Wenzhouxiangella sp. XN24]